MTTKYLGETSVKISDTPFASYTREDWSMYFIESYGGSEGHHNAWVLDQIARILKKTPVKVKLAKWSNGHEEYRVSVGKPSKQYLAWRKELVEANKDDEADEDDEDDGDGYDEGIPP